MKTAPSIARIEPGDATLRRRMLVCGSGLLAIFSLLSWRLVHLQVERHDHYSELRESRGRRVDVLDARRGHVFDARGRLLAGDEPVQRVIFDVGFLRDMHALASAVGAAEKLPATDLRRTCSREMLQERYVAHAARVMAPWLKRTPESLVAEITSRFTQRMNAEVVLARELPVSDGILLREALEQAQLGEFQELRCRIGAVIFNDTFARRYPATVPVHHIVGRFGEPPVKPGAEPTPPTGVSGVERSFNEHLAGRPGQRVLEVDGRGRELAAYRGEAVPPQHGRSFRLTIDTGLQELVEQEIDNPAPPGKDELSVAAMKPDRVIVVLFEPATMALRAMVTRDFTRRPDAPPVWSNDLVEYVYEPGSTIKVGTIAAALSEGRVTPATTLSIDPDGDRTYDDEDIEPIRDDHAFPQLTVEGIMVHSSNIGAYKLARQIGLTKFRRWIDDLGFAKPTGVQLPLEAKGLFPRQWTMQALSRAAYGYAYSVTPAQMCTMLGCVLNDGRWRPLQVADAWTDEKGAVLESMPLPEGRQVLTPKAAAQVRDMLLQVVEEGTAKLARSTRFEIGGKTGTANKIRRNGRGYDRERQVVSFLGFISAASGPRLAGICIVDEPKLASNLNYGGRLAAPLFRRIAERAMDYYEVPAQFVETTAPGAAPSRRTGTVASTSAKPVAARAAKPAATSARKRSTR